MPVGAVIARPASALVAAGWVPVDWQCLLVELDPRQPTRIHIDPPFTGAELLGMTKTPAGQSMVAGDSSDGFDYGKWLSESGILPEDCTRAVIEYVRDGLLLIHASMLPAVDPTEADGKLAPGLKGAILTRYPGIRRSA